MAVALGSLPSSEPALLGGYDLPLLACGTALLAIGLMMVTSASMPIAQTLYHDPLYFFWRQLLSLGFGVFIAWVASFIPLSFWQRVNVFLLLMGIFALLLVVIPNIGQEVNGSMRWFKLAGISIQPSEPMKLLMILYLAGYLIRRYSEVREAFSGFAKPMALLIVIGGLMLLEPDYGATVVLFATTLGLLFLAGVPLRQFLLWISIVVAAFGLLVLLAPYRIQRLTGFIDPWADPFNSGFQLTQALIAIGRGGIFGVGLGNSVQKLTYLPEAHTDFVFAILAEETGLFGVILVLALFTLLVLRAFWIAIHAEKNGLYYAAYTAFGIGLLLGLQAAINIGVNMGLLPTKGLALPFMSYGGSSLVINCLTLGLLLRIEYETRLKANN